MPFAFPVLLIVLVPFVLTLLAWIAGVQAMAVAGDPKAPIQGRILPPMLLLTGPVAVVLVLFWLRLGHVASSTVSGRMIIIGAAAAVAALITAMRAPRGFRALALSAAAGWVVCFGLAVMALFALSGLR